MRKVIIEQIARAGIKSESKWETYPRAYDMVVLGKMPVTSAEADS